MLDVPWSRSAKAAPLSFVALFASHFGTSNPRTQAKEQSAEQQSATNAASAAEADARAAATQAKRAARDAAKARADAEAALTFAKMKAEAAEAQADGGNEGGESPQWDPVRNRQEEPRRAEKVRGAPRLTSDRSLSKKRVCGLRTRLWPAVIGI